MGRASSRRKNARYTRSPSVPVRASASNRTLTYQSPEGLSPQELTGALAGDPKYAGALDRVMQSMNLVSDTPTELTTLRADDITPLAPSESAPEGTAPVYAVERGGEQPIGYVTESTPPHSERDLPLVVMCRNNLPVPETVDFLSGKTAEQITEALGISSIDDLVIDDLLTDTERGDFSTAHHLWERTIFAALAADAGEPIPTAVRYMQTTPRLHHDWQPPQTVMVLYPDGHIASNAAMHWHGLVDLVPNREGAQWSGQELRAISFAGFHEQRGDGTDDAFLLFDPLAVVISTQAEKLYQPRAVYDALPAFERNWLDRHAEWPPDNKTIGKLLSADPEMFDAAASMLKERGVPLPSEHEALTEAVAGALSDFLDMTDKTGPSDRTRPLLATVRSATRADTMDQNWLAAWRSRISKWQDEALEKGGDLCEAKVYTLQPELKHGAADFGIEYDPPHRFQVFYPTGRVNEFSCQRWAGLIRITNVERDLALMGVIHGPAGGGIIFDPRVVVLDVTPDGDDSDADPVVVYSPRAHFQKLEGPWKRWMREHQEWPLPRKTPNSGPAFAHGHTVAFERMYETARWVLEQRPYQNALGRNQAHVLTEHGATKITDPALLDRRLANQLADCKPFYWEGHMVDLLLEMQRELPPWALTLDQLPERGGYIVFERPLPLPSSEGETSNLQALMWHVEETYPAENGTTRIGAAVTAFVQHSSFPAGIPQGELPWYVGQTTEEVIDDAQLRYMATVEEAPHLERTLGSMVERMEASMRYFAACINFLQQKIVITSLRPAERHARKRLQRYVEDPPPVRVIELRKQVREYLVKTDNEPQQVEWKRRWWVRKHFKPQYYPSLGPVGDPKAYRNILIMPFPKGPAHLELPPPPEYLYVVKR